MMNVWRKVERAFEPRKRGGAAARGLTASGRQEILGSYAPSFRDCVMDHPELFDPELWCALSLPQKRERLAAALLEQLGDAPAVQGTRIGVGPTDRPFDLTAAVETDVGELRTPTWSQAQAELFCDRSVHPANRAPQAPGHAIRTAAETLRGRLAVPFALESRGLTLKLVPEPGVERSWTAERSRFRNRTAVTREDRVTNAGDVDVRDLLAHFYTGPALRLVAADGVAFLLPEAAEAADGRLVTLCPRCGRWAEGSHPACPDCGAAAETMIATRPARRSGF